MSTHRLRAPSTDGALLADPPLSEAGPGTRRQRRPPGALGPRLPGATAGRLRDHGASQVLEKSRAYLGRLGLDVPDVADPSAPLVVTGHQPELFHPGVWVKNFAVAAIAPAPAGTGLNLIVDNDIPKSSSHPRPLRERRRGLARPSGRLRRLGGRGPLRGPATSTTRAGSPPSAIGSRRALDGLVADPLIDDFWPRAVARRGETDRIGLRFAAARRELEASWGVRNLEVPLSAVCETEGFLWFASHILAHLPRFQEVHNEALARYRAVYGIRSRHHPVPALGRQGDWREAPFWVWRGPCPEAPSALMVRQLSRTMETPDRRRGRTRCWRSRSRRTARPAAPSSGCMSLPALGVRLRTAGPDDHDVRRLLLGDLFVHGIGGAKYDELGDEIIRGFFGIEPPGFLTLSMTLWLGLGLDPASPERLGAVNAVLRDLTYNPDRHLDGPVARTSRDWSRPSGPRSPARSRPARQRLARFAAIRRLQ